MAFSEIAIRLAVAAICGAAIGFERENQRKPAGLRTHMLVAIGSAAFTLASLQTDQMENLNMGGPRIPMDPSRVIQGIAGGIGFLGAGAILRSNGSVYGLTTAATIWVVGAVGICCGLGNYALAATTSVLVVLIAGSLGFLEGWIFAHRPISPETDASTENSDENEPSSKDQPQG
jgi:putative Mg2+ transporter-C (MgtC) family protein